MGLGCKLSVDLHLMCKKGWVQLQVELEFATKTKINQARIERSYESMVDL